MAYQITLTDDEYAALKVAAEQRRSTVEALVHEALAERFETAVQPTEPTELTESTPESKRPRTQQEFLEYMYRKGTISNRDDAVAVGVTPPAFACADTVLLGVASAERLTVENSSDRP